MGAVIIEPGLCARSPSVIARSVSAISPGAFESGPSMNTITAMTTLPVTVGRAVGIVAVMRRDVGSCVAAAGMMERRSSGSVIVTSLMERAPALMEAFAYGGLHLPANVQLRHSAGNSRR